MTYAQFKSKWMGSRVDFDRVYAYQCVDLILQYAYECFGVTGIWGNAIDYSRASNANAKLREKMDLLNTRDCRQGDIVSLTGLSGNPYGHIGICDSQDANNVTILEQNGHGSGGGTGSDAIRLRAIPKSRIAGVLRPKSAPTPPPVSAPPGRQIVHLPGSVQSWAFYRLGSSLRKGTTDQVATLAPAKYGGLDYLVVSWVGNYAVVIDTQMFGRGVIWVKDTEAQFRNG